LGEFAGDVIGETTSSSLNRSLSFDAQEDAVCIISCAGPPHKLPVESVWMNMPPPNFSFFVEIVRMRIF